MKHWEFWPQATWFGVCTAIVLAVWAPYLVRGKPVHWLEHDGTATIVAGVIQAAVAFAAIMISVGLARRESSRQSKREQISARTKRFELRKRAGTLTRLAMLRTASIADQLKSGNINPASHAELIVDAYSLYCEALGRIHFEDFNPREAAAFEMVYSLALAGRRVGQELRATCREADAQERSGEPLAVWRALPQARSTAIHDLASIEAELEKFLPIFNART
jgi:hypothetical protein